LKKAAKSFCASHGILQQRGLNLRNFGVAAVGADTRRNRSFLLLFFKKEALSYFRRLLFVINLQRQNRDKRIVTGYRLPRLEWERVCVVEPVVRRSSSGKRRIFWLVLLLVVAFVGYRIIFVGVLHDGVGGARRGGVAPQAVGVAKVATGPMPVVLDELGTVTPIATVTVLPQISGYLTQVAFTEGQDVTKGQFLAQIDPRPYQIALEQFEATLAKDEASLQQARSDLARYQQLLRQASIQAQTVADQQFLVAQDLAATQVDQANIDTEKLNLVYCHIVSPVTGRIGLRLVDPGNYVTANSTTGLAMVTTIAPTTVEFSVAQTQLTPVLEQLAKGATLTAEAYGSDDTTKLEDGTLTAVDNVVDTSTGMVKLRATFANADEVLFPDEFVNVHLLVDTLLNATLVPSQAVQSGAPGSYVYVVNSDDTVSVQTVTTGPTDGTNTVILKGLSPGQVVVTDGVDRLSAGARVVVPAAAGAPSAAPANKRVEMFRHRHGHGGGQAGMGQNGGGQVGGGASGQTQAAQ
jgi:membrane fusion protein, multidrug efflux system